MTASSCLIGTIGIPVIPILPIVDEEFPCRDHGCGCLSAEMCRTRCCCRKSVHPSSATERPHAHPAPPHNRKAGKSCCTLNSRSESPVESRAGRHPGNIRERILSPATPLGCQGIKTFWASVLTFWQPPAEICPGITPSRRLPKAQRRSTIAFDTPEPPVPPPRYITL